MGQTSGEIKARISQERGQLTGNINELRSKVQSSLDWRAQVDSHPLATIGVAMVGGMLAAAVIGRGHSTDSRAIRRFSDELLDQSQIGSSATQYQKRKVSESWDKTKATLIGLLATRAQQFLADAIPGFRDEYTKAESLQPSSTGNVSQFERTAAVSK